jgi:aldehyde dehydrogenase (NAD+)
LSEKWDYIFFTGSVPVGKIVYQAAAKHLTPVTLELGGKSPAIIDETVNIEKGIKRLLWGKFVNCGQTCVAPDYILVQESIKDKVITRMKALLQEFYGTDISNHPVYGRIINDRHFQRLAYLLKDEKILLGGEMRAEEKFISPTLVEVTNLDSPLMQDEIFGPILPIISYKTLEEAIAIVHSHPKPLALYVFSENQKNIKQILESTSFGGGCVNETLMHLGTHHLPFGGVGDSGIGSYHGKYTFETFSHLKSIMYKATWMDLPVRYPHQQLPLSWLKRLQRWTI